MKRILTALLSATLIISMLAVSVFAWEKPLGSAEGSTVSELTPSTDVPVMSKLISQGLTSSEVVTTKNPLASNYKDTEKNAALTNTERADIANQFKYGFSVVGLGNVGRPVGAAIDGYFATGSGGGQVASGMTSNGAFASTLNDQIYNVKGESVAADSEEIPAGYAYRLMFTFNFGKIANLDSFGFVNTWKPGVPLAADIYVSDNGTDWTLVGYYDRSAAVLTEGKEDYPYQDGAALGEDVKGNSYAASEDGKVLLMFDLPENTSGQFLRIACSSGVGKSGTFTEYGANLQDPSAEHAFRELMVWGTLTDNVGYTYPEGDGDYVAPVTPDENEGEGEDESDAPATPQTKPSTKPKDDETEAPATEPVTEASTQATNNTEESGCASGVGIGFAVLVSVSAGAVMLVKRRKDS